MHALARGRPRSRRASSACAREVVRRLAVDLPAASAAPRRPRTGRTPCATSVSAARMPAGPAPTITGRNARRHAAGAPRAQRACRRLDERARRRAGARRSRSRIQQSWQAPIRQKPARGAPLNSLRRSCAGLRQHRGEHGVARQRGRGRPSSVKCTARAVGFGQASAAAPWGVPVHGSSVAHQHLVEAVDAVEHQHRDRGDAPPSAPRPRPSAGRSTRWRTCTCAPAGSRCDGAVTKIDIVTSSKLLMKASSQPPVTPGRIIGSVMRRNTVAWLAPSDSAACSALRSKPDQRGHHQAQHVGRDDHHVRQHQPAEAAGARRSARTGAAAPRPAPGAE